MAICAWERRLARIVPWRTPLQLEQLQFHCGNAPPAADPRILIRMRGSLQFSVYVGIDFATEVDFFETWGNPLHMLNSVRW